MCALTTGMRIDEVVHYWRKKLKWESPSEKEVVNSIQSKMIDLIKKNGSLLPGVLDTLKLLKEKNIPIALASSSAMVLIDTVVNSLEIKDYFNTPLENVKVMRVNISITVPLLFGHGMRLRKSNLILNIPIHTIPQ